MIFFGFENKYLKNSFNVYIYIYFKIKGGWEILISSTYFLCFKYFLK